MGHGFFVLHGKFEDMYNYVANKVDEIAERMLMLGGQPDPTDTPERGKILNIDFLKWTQI